MKNNTWKYPRLSYSRISEFISDGPISLIHRKKRNTLSLTKGSIVDDLISLTMKDFNEKYIITRLPYPTASLKILADRVIEICIKKKIPHTKVNIEETIKELGLWSSIKNEDTLKKKYSTNVFYTYIENSIKSVENNIKIVPREVYNEGEYLANVIKNDKEVSYNFHNNDKNIENIFQQKFEFKYKGIGFLGYYDVLQIDHYNKTIQIKDLKTTSSKHTEFMSSFLKWKYYLQSSLYTLSLPSVMKQLNVEDYKILPFSFIFASFITKKVMTYVVTDKWINAGIYGFKTSNRNTVGIDQAIRDIKWHVENQVFDETKFIHINNKKITLEDSFITINEEKYEGE